MLYDENEEKYHFGLYIPLVQVNRKLSINAFIF